jgi:hypothetical protein
MLADAGEGVIESTKESVRYRFKEGDQGRGKERLLVFEGDISKPQPSGKHDVIYVPGGPTKVEWVHFVWGDNSQPASWDVQMNPAGIKFPPNRN